MKKRERKLILYFVFKLNRFIFLDIFFILFIEGKGGKVIFSIVFFFLVVFVLVIRVCRYLLLRENINFFFFRYSRGFENVFFYFVILGYV